MNDTLGFLLTVSSREALKNVNDLTKALDDTDNALTKVGRSIKGAFNKTSIVGFYTSMKDLLNTMMALAKPQAEFIENLNLMDTAFGKNKDSAHELIDEMSNIFGLDTSKMTKQLGTYRQMSSAMGLTSEAADMLSKNLLKMQEDVSSLYNISDEKIATKLQSAMAGQSRAVRSLGVDITTTGLQNELYRRGINMTVDSLNSASKEVLIYLTMEHQLQNAQGDLAKTNESVANQMRIFKDETVMLARNIGGLLIPVLRSVLPVLNGILMAINSIMASILAFFGIDAKKLSNEFGITEVETGFDDLGKSVDGVGKKAKAAKKELRGFDKLNVINTPTSSSTSGTGGSGGGGGFSTSIPKELLEALKDYDNKMAGLKTKAQEIRDIILDILKPLKEPIGAGLEYLWEEVLKPMGEWAKTTLLPKVIEALKSTFNTLAKITSNVLNPALKFLMENVLKPLGKFVGRTIVKAFENWKIIMDTIAKSKILTFLIGGTGLVIAFQKLIGVVKNVINVLGKTKLLGSLMAYDDVLIDSIKKTKSLTSGWTLFVQKAITGKTKLDKVNSSIKLGVKGIIDAFAGMTIVGASLDDINENGHNLINTLGILVGTILAVKGGIEATTAVVAIFNATAAANPITAVIGALVGVGGLVASLVLTDQEFDNSNEKVDETNKKLEEYKKKLKESRDEIENSSLKLQIQSEQSQAYRNELANLIDDNGKVKGSYAEVDKAIGYLNSTLDLNITRNGDQLTLDGKLIDKREDLIGKIDETINKMKEEGIQAMANKAIEDEIQRQIDIRKEENKIIGDLKKSAEDYDLTNEKEAKNFYSRNEDKIKKLGDLEGAYKQSEDQIGIYSQALSEAQQGNFDQAINHMSKTAKKSKTEITDIMGKIDSTLTKTYSTKIIAEVNIDTRKAEEKMAKKQREWAKSGIIGEMTFNNTYGAMYASGGFPEDGFFFANHNEMVGKFSNGKTAVANNDQIVDGISAGVARAILSTRGSNQAVNITVKADDDSFARFLKFKTNQDDRQFGF